MANNLDVSNYVDDNTDLDLSYFKSKIGNDVLY